MKSLETLVSLADDDATESQVNRATVRNPRLRAALVIIVLLVCSAVAILVLSSPTQREVHLDAFVEKFSLPTNIELDLLELNKIHLRGVRIDLSRIASLRVGNDKALETITTFPALSIKEKKDAPTSSAILQLVGRKGASSTALPKDAIIKTAKSASGEGLSFKATPPDRKTIDAATQADEIAIPEANRVAIQPSLPSSTLNHPDSYALFASNPIAMVNANCSSSAECVFTLNSAAEFSFLPNGYPLLANRGETIFLPGCILKQAIFRGVKDSDMSLDIPSDIDIIPGKDFKWIRIMISSLSPSESTFIRISARGKVASIRQDGREVLPTRFSDLLGADPATRGLYGGVGLLLVATWTVLFKRATDVLAKNILPE